MQCKNLSFQKGFHVGLGNIRAQAAEMVLAPGEQEGDAGNRHRGSDQWLFVVSGQGQAIVNKKTYELHAGTLLLIEAGDIHEVKNTGSELLKTLNIYAPPAYDEEGNPLPRGKS